MDVTILGSGTAVPVPDRFPSGLLVRDGADVVLVDLGPGVMHRAAEAGVEPGDVTGVLITHFHTDHTADLAALLYALRNPRYAGRPPLRIVGPVGLRELLGHLTAAWRWLEPRGYDLIVDEVTPGTFELGGLAVTAVAVVHTDHSLAYRIESPAGGVLAVSGDASPCDGLVEVARGADLFICEAAFPAAARTDGHLTPGLAARAAALAGTRRLVLTHFYPECAGHDLLAEAQAEFAGDVVLAEDLMTFEV